MARADVLIGQSATDIQFSVAGTQYVVETVSGALYIMYIDSASDFVFKKSTDGGFTWTSPTALSGAVAGSSLSVWYDRWSDIAAGLIHCAYTDNTAADVLYRSIDTENSDTLSTQTVVFAGTSGASGAALSICRARGGNLGVVFNIDNGTEDGFAKSTDVGANWAAAADPTEATSDFFLLAPGWAADDQDLMLFFWDRSNNEISYKPYDDDGDVWDETSIDAAMVDVAATTCFPNFAMAVDIANSQNILVAWNAVDTANQDLKAWTVTEAATTALTNVVTDGTDDMGVCGIGIDTVTGYWYAFYAGKSDGSQTFPTAVHLYYKVSTDEGATWGAETQITNETGDYAWLVPTPRFTDDWVLAFHKGVALNEIRASARIPTGGGWTLHGSVIR